MIDSTKFSFSDLIVKDKKVITSSLSTQGSLLSADCNIYHPLLKNHIRFCIQMCDFIDSRLIGLYISQKTVYEKNMVHLK